MAISIARKREMNTAIITALFNSNGVVRSLNSGELVQLTHVALYGKEDIKETLFGFVEGRDICINALALNRNTNEVELSRDMLCPIHNENGLDTKTLLSDFEDVDGNYVWSVIHYA